MNIGSFFKSSLEEFIIVLLHRREQFDPSSDLGSLVIWTPNLERKSKSNIGIGFDLVLTNLFLIDCETFVLQTLEDFSVLTSIRDKECMAPNV